jgi:hypothetical protein
MPILFNADEVSMKRKYNLRSHSSQENVRIMCIRFLSVLKFFTTVYLHIQIFEGDLESMIKGYRQQGHKEILWNDANNHRDQVSPLP